MVTSVSGGFPSWLSDRLGAVLSAIAQNQESLSELISLDQENIKI